MKISRNRVYDALFECEQLYGGYKGEDITRIAHTQGIAPRVLRRDLERWRTKYHKFAILHYRGQRTIPLGIMDYEFLQDRYQDNPVIKLVNLHEGLNRSRKIRGLEPLPQSSFYRIMDGVSHAQLSQTTSELDWFRSNQINVSPGYSVTEARKSLSTHFVYDGLKPRGRVSLHRFSDRLDDAALWFREAHPSADPLARYPRILKRAKLLRGQLSTISGDESPGVQARLAFECQVAFLVEGHDAAYRSWRMSAAIPLSRIWRISATKPTKAWTSPSACTGRPSEGTGGPSRRCGTSWHIGWTTSTVSAFDPMGHLLPWFSAWPGTRTGGRI